MYMAESSSVLFCTSTPLINTRFSQEAQATHISRAQMGILGSHR